MTFGPENFKIAPNLETIIAVAICLIVAIFAIIVGILAKKSDPKKAPKGVVLLGEWAVEKIDNFTKENMGEGFENFGGILLGIIAFLSLNFLVGITGLPTPMAYLPVPLSLGLVTFTLIHYTSIRFTHWKYFKRYVDPFPFFLPINLISMWAPLLSLSLRLFGNALVGFVLLTLVNFGLEFAGAAIFSIPLYYGANGIELASNLTLIPFVTPVLHAYFDVFSTFIQTLVFVYLTTLFVAQEKPESDVKEELEVGSRKEITQ